MQIPKFDANTNSNPIRFGQRAFGQVNCPRPQQISTVTVAAESASIRNFSRPTWPWQFAWKGGGGASYMGNICNFVVSTVFRSRLMHPNVTDSITALQSGPRGTESAV